jgi:hypothetical protein
MPGKLGVHLKMASPRRYRDPVYMGRLAGEIYGGRMRNSPELVQKHMRHVRWSSDYGYYLQLIPGVGLTSLPWLGFLRQPTLVFSDSDLAQNLLEPDHWGGDDAVAVILSLPGMLMAGFFDEPVSGNCLSFRVNDLDLAVAKAADAESTAESGQSFRECFGMAFAIPNMRALNIDENRSQFFVNDRPDYEFRSLELAGDH